MKVVVFKYVVCDRFVLDFDILLKEYIQSQKKSKYTAVFLSIKNETQCVLLFSL